MKRTIFCIFILACLFFVSGLFAGENEMIQSTASFILDRANETLICMFQDSILSNKLVGKYFPATSKALEIFDLKILMTNKSLWENNVKKDLDGIVQHLKDYAVSKSSALKSGIEISENEELVELENTIKDGKYAFPKNVPEILKSIKDLNIEDKESAQALTVNINQFAVIISSVSADSINGLNAINEKISELNAQSPDTEIKSMRKELAAYLRIHKKNKILLEYAKHVNRYLKNIKSDQQEAGKDLNELYRVKDEFVVGYLSGIKNKLDELNKDVGQIYNAYNYIINISTESGNYTDKVTNIFLFIEGIDSLRKHYRYGTTDYRKVKNIVYFFAQIADIQDNNDDQIHKQDEMRLVLKAYALPPNSYKAKRRDDMHFSISAYLGGTVGGSTENHDWDKYYGIIAPLGVEYGWGTKGQSSDGFMLSVFDLGAVINSQIYNKSETFTFQDITAPGIVYLHGFKGLPLSFGAGYFKVKGLKNGLSDEQRAVIFLAIDIPLFAL